MISTEISSTRGLVIPKNWHKQAVKQIRRLNVQPPVQLIPAPDYERLPKSELSNAISSIVRATNLQSAIIILPTHYATGTNMTYWPDTIVHSPSQRIITSVCFADKWCECYAILDKYLDENPSEKKMYNATCQYQRPYTEMLDAWVNEGAQGFHPGDFTKQEFLDDLSKMEGHWLYWGHSDGDKLRAYRHISSQDILVHRPKTPLRSTLWFSCSTLNSNNERNIALDWFLSGSTLSLMASPTQVKTTDNQLLGLAWLKATQLSKGISNIADIIHHLLDMDSQTFGPILQQYRLLGSPWVGFGW